MVRLSCCRNFWVAQIDRKTVADAWRTSRATQQNRGRPSRFHPKTKRPFFGFRFQRLLKYCTAFSCFFAAAFVLNVPRFLRFPVFGFFLREYNRYLPDLSFLIMRTFPSRAAHRCKFCHRASPL